MPDDYTTSMLMADVMETVQDNIGPVIQVALFLAAVNFVFGMLYWALQFVLKAPFSSRY